MPYNVGFYFKMAKKDEFSGIRKIKDLKENRHVSFYIPAPKDELPKDICDIKIDPISDLNIVTRRGRQSGYIPNWSPETYYNFYSQSQRLDRSLDKLPDRIVETPERITYFFCQPDSSTLFWEVVVELNPEDLFLTLNPEVLTIICPVPFNLQGLVVVDTNATELNWSQIQGRTTIVAGENTLNPIISIIGDRPTDTEDVPILLLAETSDPNVFAILAIRTTIRDFIDQPRIAAKTSVNPDSNKGLSIQNIYPRLGIYNAARMISDANPTFFLVLKTPLVDVLSIQQFKLYFNNLSTGYEYSGISAPLSNMQFPVNFGLRYKVEAERLNKGRFYTNKSKPFDLSNEFFIAADSFVYSSIRNTKSNAIRYIFGGVQQRVDDTIFYASISSLVQKSVINYPLKTRKVDYRDDLFCAAISGISKREVVRYKLNGQIVG